MYPDFKINIPESLRCLVVFFVFCFVFWMAGPLSQNAGLLKHLKHQSLFYMASSETEETGNDVEVNNDMVMSNW